MRAGATLWYYQKVALSLSNGIFVIIKEPETESKTYVFVS